MYRVTDQTDFHVLFSISYQSSRTAFYFSAKVRKFYVVFLLVNNFDGDVVVSNGLPGTSGQITMKPGDTVVVSEQPTNNKPISVTAVDTATSGVVNINGQSSISIKPDKTFGASFQVLSLGTETPGKLAAMAS